MKATRKAADDKPASEPRGQREDGGAKTTQLAEVGAAAKLKPAQEEGRVDADLDSLDNAGLSRMKHGIAQRLTWQPAEM